MRERRISPTGLSAPLLLAAALVLAGCSGNSAAGDGGASGSTSEASAAGSASGPAATTASGSAAGAPSGSPVSCSGTSCSVTLTGDVTSVSVLGTRVTFGGVQDGQATLGVGGRQLACRQGDSVSAGPLRLTCTTVQPDRVALRAGLGG